MVRTSPFGFALQITSVNAFCSLQLSALAILLTSETVLATRATGNVPHLTVYDFTVFE